MSTPDQIEKVKKFRNMTGLGIVYSKRIMKEINYDLEKAEEFMKTDEFHRMVGIPRNITRRD